MAQVKLNSAFTQVHGKLSKRENTVLRQKKYRADNGAVLNYGAQEAYEIQNPRDYKKNPPKGTELRNITSFAEASRLTTRLIQAGQFSDEQLATMPDELRAETEALRQQLAQFKVRFKAQLSRPDPQAPVLAKNDSQFNPNSGKIQRRQYRTLNTFIRAILLQSLRKQQ